MIERRRCYLWWCAVAVLALWACSARADIPDFVDYHVKWSGYFANGDWTIQKDDLDYGDPWWEMSGTLMRVPNQADPNRVKEVWMEVEYRSPPPSIPPAIELTLPGSGTTQLVTAPNAAGNGYTLHWQLDPQPEDEWFEFPSSAFYDLSQVASVEIGTFCATTTVHKPQILYGKLDQNPLGTNTCGPTATANSFAYLERAYPETYRRLLVPDIPGEPDFGTAELTSVAEELKGFMGWDPTGVSTQGMIEGKALYFDIYAPGTTELGAMMKGTWSGTQPKWVKDGLAPTWEWLNEQLLSCEDVEIAIKPDGGGTGHVLTLTGMTWQDDGDGNIESGEATIDYINPDGGVAQQSSIFMSGGQLWTSYNGSMWSVDAAVKESVPEPATLCMLLALGGLALLWRRRR